MGRPRKRVCLQDGLKLDLNRLARNGAIQCGANIGSRGMELLELSNRTELRPPFASNNAPL